MPDAPSSSSSPPGGADDKLAPIDFSTFVLSLTTSALYQLGRVPGPDGETVETPDRLLAQQTVETLEMLARKTRGNLDEDEQKLLDSLLYELRVQFVQSGGA